MPKFWSLISNGKYSVGCTGQTVYIYDQNGAELAKFKDLPYAYTAAFSPKGDIFAVKSTAGRLAVYSLKQLCLIQKFRFSKVDGSQDDNFCFSPDGERFYNIERHAKSYNTALSVYRTSDFSLERRLFETDPKTELATVEFDPAVNDCYLLGFFRDDKNSASEYFVAKLCGDELGDVKYISEDTFDFYRGYKDMEAKGFTEQSKKWQTLKYLGYDLTDIETQKYSLTDLWRNH